MHAITYTTILKIYPHYYPKGVVEFFLAHHTLERIQADILQNRVFLCYDTEENAVGTVTLHDDEIARLFVLPTAQGRGYGKALLDFAESRIFEAYSRAWLDVSLAAKGMYLGRGYVAIDYRTLPVAYGDVLCYDVMEKRRK